MTFEETIIKRKDGYDDEVKNTDQKLTQQSYADKVGEIYAYYRISPVVVPQSNKEKIEDHKAEFRILFKELEKYKDIHLEMYPQYLDLEQRFGSLEKDFHPSTLEIGRYYNSEAIKLLNQELGRVTQPILFLGFA
ncbi:hypothetical protein HOO54_00965 [Bacillus sp. WMMC1349]|uniref:hypothetical protein n=1 Tax=Bacillus sp. WMMC1349 TaxID=2736254 RepID=UPI0015545039|nr:hypothetical protein [Bacillus sp. WMMC1349]NPC90874.1 hypothetical protein [Bacillus sp. WMMC1349]